MTQPVSQSPKIFNLDYHISGLFSIDVETIKKHCNILKNNLDTIPPDQITRLIHALSQWDRETIEYRYIYKLILNYCNHDTDTFNKIKWIFDEILDEELDDASHIANIIYLAEHFKLTEFTNYLISYINTDIFPPSVNLAATNALTTFINIDPTIAPFFVKEIPTWNRNIAIHLIKILTSTKSLQILPLLHYQLNKHNSDYHPVFILDQLKQLSHYSSIPPLMKFADEDNPRSTDSEKLFAWDILRDILITIDNKFN